MKTCSCCKQPRVLAAYQKSSASRDGLQPRCRDCQAEAMRRWYRKNAERVSDRAAAWHKANPQKVVAKTATWNARNADRVKVRMAKWKADNKAAVCAISGRYRAARRGATPLWASRADIDMWYEVAEVLSRGGVEFHVDHVVPLQSKRVCGLHTHDNLTVIPWFQNLAKGNRQWPDMP